MPFKIPPIQGVICVFMLLMVTLPMNVVQVTAYFVLPRAVGRKISARLFQQAGYLMFMFSDYFSNVELVLYGDRIPEEESALLISNHLGAELVHFFQLAYRAKMLHALRFVQKDGLKWIPVNWTCYLHEHVFVKRGTANSRAESAKMMREKLGSFGEDKVPIWMVVFPEGTWVAGPEEQNLVDRSQAFAKKNNLAVYKNVLTPRTAGFCATVDGAAVSVAASEDSLAALCEPTSLSVRCAAAGHALPLHRPLRCGRPLNARPPRAAQTTSPSRTTTNRQFSARRCHRRF
jgi:1-acyl-sn-glycerol-3-phosphate acyltransferase